jgi:hypothetical protein
MNNDRIMHQMNLIFDKLGKFGITEVFRSEKMDTILEANIKLLTAVITRLDCGCQIQYQQISHLKGTIFHRFKLC